MTKEELAKKIDGIVYGTDIPHQLVQEAKESGLVIVYGASDDLMEMEGAIYDEGDCYGGEKFLIDHEGILPRYDDIEDEDEMDEYIERKKKSKIIHAIRCAQGEPAWTYKTKIPHVTFNVMDDGDVYCRGIVFDTKDL